MSFPSERREYVEHVANALLPVFGGDQGKARIFFITRNQNSGHHLTIRIRYR